MPLENFSFTATAIGANAPINPHWEAIGEARAIMHLGPDWREVCVVNPLERVVARRYGIVHPSSAILQCGASDLTVPGQLWISANQSAYSDLSAVNMSDGTHGKVRVNPSGLIVFRESRINGMIHDPQDGVPAQQWLYDDGSLELRLHYKHGRKYDPDKFTPYSLGYRSDGSFLESAWADGSSLSEQEVVRLLAAAKQEKTLALLETETEVVALQRNSPIHISKTEGSLCR